jgi:hypothetical protein
MAKKKKKNESEDPDDGTEMSIVLQEIQVILAHKRTSLAEMRTGIMILTIPMSVFTVLVATSELYNVFAVLPLFTSLMVISVGLLFFAAYLIIRSLRKVFFFEERIHDIRQTYPYIRKHVRTGRFIGKIKK